MIRRLLAAFGLVLLYMAALAGFLSVAVMLAGDDDAAIRVAVLVFFVLILALFVPYLEGQADRRCGGLRHPLPHGHDDHDAQVVAGRDHAVDQAEHRQPGQVRR